MARLDVTVHLGEITIEGPWEEVREMIDKARLFDEVGLSLSGEDNPEDESERVSIADGAGPSLPESVRSLLSERWHRGIPLHDVRDYEATGNIMKIRLLDPDADPPHFTSESAVVGDEQSSSSLRKELDCYWADLRQAGLPPPWQAKLHRLQQAHLDQEKRTSEDDDRRPTRPSRGKRG